MTEQINTIRRTAVERILENSSQKPLLEVLKNTHIYDIIEVSRQEDILKLCEVLRFLPDDPAVSFILHITYIDDPRLMEKHINPFTKENSQPNEKSYT